jgi:hypothetical protein
MRILDELKRDRSTDTGLSLVDGDPINSVGDLPEHAVEIHVLGDASLASAFVDGLRVAGTRNALVWTWQAGDLSANRTVIVARLDEPRPDAETWRDAVKVVEHARSSLDSDTISRHNKESIEQRDREYEALRAKTLPIRQAAEAAGLKVTGIFSGCVRTNEIDISFGDAGFSTRIMYIERPLTLTGEKIDAIFAESAAACGVKYDTEEREFAAGPFASLDDAIASAASFRAAEAACKKAFKAEYDAAFVASMRMTPSRRRFLAAGAEHGFRLRSVRCSTSAWAGPHKAGPSEYHALVRIGWIRFKGPIGEVTEAGLAAMAGKPAAKAEVGTEADPDPDDGLASVCGP